MVCVNFLRVCRSSQELFPGVTDHSCVDCSRLHRLREGVGERQIVCRKLVHSLDGVNIIEHTSHDAQLLVLTTGRLCLLMVNFLPFK